MAVGFVGKGFGASLEVVIIDKAKKEIVWGGSGEFKRGGVFGFGSTENNQAAEEWKNSGHIVYKIPPYLHLPKGIIALLILRGVVMTVVRIRKESGF